MSDITPIFPSEQELKAATIIHAMPTGPTIAWKMPNEFALVIATHTRCDGLTAKEWKAKFEVEISAEWQKAWLQMKSALAEAQGVIAAARVSATDFKTGLPDSDKRKGDLNRLADALVAYDSRHPAKPETKTGE